MDIGEPPLWLRLVEAHPIPAFAGTSVQGKVWVDTSADGIRQTGEPGYSGGLTVTLVQGGSVVATTTTDSSGQYTFHGVLPGTYSVQFALPNGYTFSPSNQGSDRSVDSDANPSSGTTASFSVVAGQVTQGPDAGLIPGVPSAAIRGMGQKGGDAAMDDPSPFAMRQQPPAGLPPTLRSLVVCISAQCGPGGE